MAGPRRLPAGGDGHDSVPTVTPPEFRQRDCGGSAGGASSPVGREAWPVGSRCARLGVRAAAYVVPGGQVTNVELIAHCARNLARFKCPTDVELVDVLPPEPGTYQPAPPGTDGGDRCVSPA